MEREFDIVLSVLVPERVVLKLRSVYESLKEAHPEFYPMSFNDWVTERLKDVAYGSGSDEGWCFSKETTG